MHFIIFPGVLGLLSCMYFENCIFFYLPKHPYVRDNTAEMATPTGQTVVLHYGVHSQRTFSTLGDPINSVESVL